MATISEALAMAFQHHQGGRLQAAEQIYRQILAVQPNHADALHLLGVIAHQAGKHEVAVQYIRRAIRLQGGAVAFHNNLGEAYRALRRISEAVACYRRALELKPDFVEAHNNLGLALKDQGTLEDAAACWRRALKLKPDYAEACNNLANVLMDQGKLEEAVACYRRALELKPDYAAAHSNLGNALKDLGKLDEAAACCRRALELKPNVAEAQNNLGNVLREQRKLDDAVVCYGRALELKPDYAEAHNNLGVTLKEQGKLDQAVDCYHRALKLQPDDAVAHGNLGVAFKEQGKLDEAAACYRRALELKPDFAETHYNLGNVLRDQEKFDQAAACYRRALELKPDYVDAHDNLGNMLKEQGKLDEALAFYRRVLELKPDFAVAHYNLGNVLREQGNLEEALASYRRALELKPDFAVAHANLGSTLEQVGDFQGAEDALRAGLQHDSRLVAAHFKLTELLRGRLPQQDLDVQRRLLEEDPASSGQRELTDAQRFLLHFGLAQVLDARGEYAEAAEHLERGNALQLAWWRNRGQEYDPKKHELFVTRMIEACTPDFFQRVRGFGLESELPVFIVGLPRSGTTLSEQILASHGRVFGAGEIHLASDTMAALGGQTVRQAFQPDIVRQVDHDHDHEYMVPDIVPDIVPDPEPSIEGLRHLDRATAQRLASQHLERLRAISPAALRIVNKMLDNYLYLGLLACLFPRAKFIHCRRDLRDVAVSCWMTTFGEVRWANDQQHIASRFHQYRRLMEHWRKVLPVPLLEVDYEETVTDLEGVARRLVAWCGLEWEPKCLEFHQTKRPVNTASVVQVRQPVYKTSLGRWKHYEQPLALLFARLEAMPDYAGTHNNLGNALKEQGELDEATACYRRALQLKPDYAEAHYNLGNVLREQGKADEATACYRRALQLKPDYAAAHGNLGNTLQQQGKLDEAIACLQRALELNPNLAETHSNLGVAFKEQGKLDEALACWHRALELKPDFAEAHSNLGGALEELGKLDEALACIHRLLELKPNSAEAHNNLGNLLKDQARLDEATACYRRALELKPDFTEVYGNLGNALMCQGKLDEAMACHRRALELKPDFAEAHNNLGGALKDQGKLDEAMACYRRALQLKPDFAKAHSNLLLTIQYRAGITPAELAEAHAEYDRQHTAPLRSSVEWAKVRSTNVSDHHGRLRLGFVSPDLGRHPVGYFLVRVLENLRNLPSPIGGGAGGEGCETFCYSDRIVKDDLTHRLQAAVTQWRDVLGMNDQRLAEQIREDRIDILFDLAGHTAHNRLLVFARKPAPIQITWIGYMCTTGLGAMDYLLTDRYEVPESAEGYYRERILRMPDGHICYDPPSYAPAVSVLPALAAGHVTFGCFNNPAKVTPQAVEVWAKILHRLPGARLVVKYKGWSDRGVARRFTDMFATQGVDRDRLELLDASPHAELLGEYGRIDVALDTLPYSGCLTTCEAMWMGVPVITCPGETLTSRQSSSCIVNAGLRETIAGDFDEYVERAVSLASDLPQLAGIRGGLREQMAASPLCDGKRFATNLLSILHNLWEQRIGDANDS